MREDTSAVEYGRWVAAELTESGWCERGSRVMVCGRGSTVVAPALRPGCRVDVARGTDELLAEYGERWDVVVLTEALSRLTLAAAADLLAYAAVLGKHVVAAVPQRHNLWRFDPAFDAGAFDVRDRSSNTASELSVWTREAMDDATAGSKLERGSRSGTASLVRFSRPALPNVLLWAPGHSATTQVVKLACRLGWCSPTADKEFSEPVGIRGLNEAVIRRQAEFSPPEATRLLDEVDRMANRAWIIKEPRLCDLWADWLPIFEPYDVTLCYLVRPAAAIQGSYARRQGVDPPRTKCRGRLVQTVIDEAEAVFEAWPGRKLRLTTEQISAAVELWDSERVAKV